MKLLSLMERLLFFFMFALLPFFANNKKMYIQTYNERDSLPSKAWNNTRQVDMPLNSIHQSQSSWMGMEVVSQTQSKYSSFELKVINA